LKSVDAAPSRGAILLLAVGWLAAAALRLGFVWGIHDTSDLRLWGFDFSVLERQGSLYGETPYNDAPLWAGLILAIGRTAQHWSWSFATSVCAFLTLVDAAIAVLVWRIVRRRANRTAAACCALLAFANPISVMASSFLGQFDNIAIAFLLVALLLSTHSSLDSLSVSGALGVSLIARHVAWFHPLLLARGPTRRHAWAVAVPYGLFLLSFLPFWRSWRQIWTNVFLYRSGAETYGLEPIREVAWLPRETATLLFIAVMLLAVWQLRRVEFGRACLLLFLVQLIVIPGVWPHYFVWPIALGAIYPSAGYLVYTLVLTAFFFKSPDVLGLDWPHLPGWWGCWWATIFWLLWEIRALRARPAAPEKPGE
jgi:hypothetical protein